MDLYLCNAFINPLCINSVYKMISVITRSSRKDTSLFTERYKTRTAEDSLKPTWAQLRNNLSVEIKHSNTSNVFKKPYEL